MSAPSSCFGQHSETNTNTLIHSHREPPRSELREETKITHLLPPSHFVLFLNNKKKKWGAKRNMRPGSVCCRWLFTRGTKVSIASHLPVRGQTGCLILSGSQQQMAAVSYTTPAWVIRNVVRLLPGVALCTNQASSLTNTTLIFPKGEMIWNLSFARTCFPVITTTWIWEQFCCSNQKLQTVQRAARRVSLFLSDLPV